MSEEVKEGQAEAAGPKKPKKVNKFSGKELAAKLEDLEKNGQAGSRFYKHLSQRKKEMGA